LKRILVVDDEAQIRTMLTQMLEQEGYTVFTAENGEEGLAMVGRHAFDLVVTDMTMPEMTGADLARMFMKIRPELPIILCSGYSDSFSMEDAQKLNIREFIMKPFSLKDLGLLVKQILKG